MFSLHIVWPHFYFAFSHSNATNWCESAERSETSAIGCRKKLFFAIIKRKYKRLIVWVSKRKGKRIITEVHYHVKDEDIQDDTYFADADDQGIYWSRIRNDCSGSVLYFQYKARERALDKCRFSGQCYSNSTIAHRYGTSSYHYSPEQLQGRNILRLCHRRCAMSKKLHTTTLKRSMHFRDNSFPNIDVCCRFF